MNNITSRASCGAKKLSKTGIKRTLLQGMKSCMILHYKNLLWSTKSHWKNSLKTGRYKKSCAAKDEKLYDSIYISICSPPSYPPVGKNKKVFCLTFKISISLLKSFLFYFFSWFFLTLFVAGFWAISFLHFVICSLD